MRIYQNWTDLTDADKGAAAAIGNFDGVHIGHQAVIDIARVEAAKTGAPLGIVTFEPHPRQVFAPDAPPFRLMSADTKANRLEKLGIECLYQIPFNVDLSSLTPLEFARDIIANGLGLSHIVVGEDFCFGKGRAGNGPDLIRFGEEFGFGVTLSKLVETSGREVSSTNIRKALADGNPRDAAAMLGHWHRIDGPVQHGEKRGREFGFPTANMSVDGLHPPKFGVYAVKADVLNGPHKGTYNGAASLGVRPMFGENRANLETYLFDFKGDLYGADLSIALVDYLRPEVTYEGVEKLIAQMRVDCAQAADILAKIP